jgi:hypothetical protein
VRNADPADNHKAGLVVHTRGNLDQIGIIPQRLSLDEVGAVLGSISIALDGIEFKLNGIISMPYLCRNAILWFGF